jgi:hypothetical protein
MVEYQGHRVPDKVNVPCWKYYSETSDLTFIKVTNDLAISPNPLRVICDPEKS